MTELPRALERLAPLVKRGMVPGLDAMRAALAASGDPQRAIPCVHVAGTNGKGSVSATVDAVLRASGLRVGLYTSPHLHRFVERVRVDGEPLGEPLAAALADAILREVDAGALPDLTFFEAATLLAWRAFEREGVAFAVLEVGLGGRLDATTVCAPRVTAITRIALEHTAVLGTTLDAIAREKAGILKPGVPCVLGPGLARALNPEAREAIEQVARAVGAPLYDAPTIAREGAAVRALWRGRELVLRPSLAGPWHAENLAVALGVIDRLCDAGVAVSPAALAAGVASVRWPARMERIGDVLLDAAHNPDGVAALVAALPEVLQKAHLGAMVFGASRDKDYAPMMATLARVIDPSRWYLAAAAMQRAAEPEALASLMGGVACESPEAALALARARCAPGEVVLVCGSIFLVAAVRAALLGIAQDPSIPL
jgi:dihydrofolate synthase/folylpolyglutamate synthase